MCRVSAPPETQGWTIGRLLAWTREWLAAREVDQPRLSAELLLAHALDCKKIDLYTRFDHQPSAEQTGRFRELVKEAGELKPIAYLIGNREFYSLEFELTSDVLIPRPESEALVARAIEICNGAGRDPFHMLDIGTGSGCLAVAICKYAPSVHCLATDISARALEVARRNVERHGLSERISLIEADVAEIPAERIPPEGFPLVISNPPYIAENDKESLDENVRRHEPHVALFAGGDGMRFYRSFAGDLPPLLAPGGVLLTEIGFDQQVPVGRVFADAGGWRHVGTHRDPADPHPRVMEFQRNQE